jgi:hypothetical protein
MGRRSQAQVVVPCLDNYLANQAMSYKEPLATNTGFGIIKPGANLTVTDGVLDVVPVALLDQGYFYNTATQTNPVASGVNLVAYDSAAVNVGITVVGGLPGSALQVSRTGNYNLQFTVQLEKTTGPKTDVNIWIRRNGALYPDTNTTLALTGSNTVLLAGWSYILALLAGDNVEIAWESPDTSVTLTAVPATAGPPARPAAPSARCTMVQL